jgi:hypothetical protein
MSACVRATISSRASSTARSTESRTVGLPILLDCRGVTGQGCAGGMMRRIMPQAQLTHRMVTTRALRVAMAATLSVSQAVCAQSNSARPVTPRPAAVAGPSSVAGLTAVAGLKVGHYTLPERPTGCTVILAEKGAVGGVDVRGSAPGTRETDLLDPGEHGPGGARHPADRRKRLRARCGWRRDEVPRGARRRLRHAGGTRPHRPRGGDLRPGGRRCQGPA